LPFSQHHADVACNFFERVLKNTQDEWAGKPFMLAPWQEEALCEIFGRLDEDGNRLIQQVYLEVPKKTGKTEFAAGLILLVLLMETTLGCQVYGAAAAQRQALNVYRAARTMVDLSPILKNQFRLLPSTSRIIKRSDPNSFYAAIAADGDLSDGVNPACTVADEVHRWRTRKQIENWDVLSQGGITRRQTLTIAITTAGVQNESPLAWQLHEKTLRIKHGISADPRFYGRIYAADPQDDWESEKTWIKAHPSLKQNGGFLDISKIRKQYESALSESDGPRRFKRYFLNLWDQKGDRAIDMAKWDACPVPWVAKGLLPKAPEDKVRPLPHDLLAYFIGRKAWPGIDLSMTTDMTAVTFVFPAEDGYYDLLPFFWMPEAGLKKAERRDGMPYGLWAEQGFLELSQGDVIDYRDVKARVLWGAQMFDVPEMCFDRYNSREMSANLIDEGYECVEIGQGYLDQNAPCKKILESIHSGKLRHGNHPILRFNALSLSTESNNDLIKFRKPDRQKDSTRIDGLQAAADGMARAMLFGASPSVYEGRGIRSL
jgi:phage terminase large subunit-like protein